VFLVGKVKLYDLSHPFGHGTPLWPYFPDVKVERFHYHAKSGVLTQWITAPMHCSTHADSPIHVLPANKLKGPMYTHELPLENYFGTGVVVSIPRGYRHSQYWLASSLGRQYGVLLLFSRSL